MSKFEVRVTVTLEQDYKDDWQATTDVAVVDVTPKASEARSALVAGEFFPNAKTTGVYDYAALTTIDSDVTYSTPNQTVTDTHFRGRVTVAASNVSFRNCLFTGPSENALSGGLIVATSSRQKGLLLEDCTIAPAVPGHVTNCIEGHSMTLRRVNSYHGTDLCSVIAPSGATRADVVIEGSWLHHPVMFNTPTQKDNLTHNDVIQWHGMKGLTVNGCRLEGYCTEDFGVAHMIPKGSWPASLASGNPFYPALWGTSIVMASPLRAQFGDFVFTNNWLDGATVGLNLTRDGAGFPDCGVITGNRFGTGWRLGADYGVLAKTSQAMKLEGNYRWDKENPWSAATPFNVRKRG